MAQISLSSNIDRVVASAPLPSECSQNNVWGDVQMVNNDGFFIDGAVIYGADGYVVPHPDPDTPDSVDDLWDILVPKDIGVSSGALDLDTSATNSGSHFEIGEPNLQAMVDVALYNDDNHWYKRRKVLSFANTPTGFHWVTGGVSTFSPRDAFKVRSRRKIDVEVMSMSLFGLAMPSLANTITTVPNSPATDAEWVQQKYLEVVLEQSWMFLVGLVETGAETPWEDAANFIVHLLEPLAFEEDAASWFTDTFKVWATFTFDITVPGVREFKQLSID